jgi:hypothetical protein
VRPVLEEACRTVWPGFTAVTAVTVDADVGDETDPAAAEDLQAEAENDPGVVLARRVIGGRIVGVRPDGGG